MKEYSLTLVSKDQGFTLLEILIAITLLAFITLGVVNITENAVITKDRTTEVNRNNLQIETALSRFEWDFSQIYSPLFFSTVMNLNQNVPAGGNVGGVNAGVDAGAQGGVQAGAQAGAQGGGGAGAQFSPELQAYYEQLIMRFERNERFSAVSREGLPIPRFYSPEKNVFEFFTSSNRRKQENIKQSHFAWVRYSLADQVNDPNEETNSAIPSTVKSLVRYFSPDDPYSDKRIDIHDANRVRGAVLMRNVENLEFQFWDMNRRRWENSLRTVNGENIIRGVRMIVTWYDSYGHKRVTSRIFRNHWPMVVPQDQPTAPRGRVQAGAQGAAGAAGGNDGDDGDDS